jgi:hypothetical protein
MALSSLVYDEGSEQVKLALDADVVEIIHKLLENNVMWMDVPKPNADILNQLGDDFKAFLHLNGVPT